MAPKYVDRDEYRRELLHQCFDLVAQQGYAAITMRQLADHLDVSMGTIYHYFKDKQALFEQLVQEVAQQNAATDLSGTVRQPADNLAEMLSQIEQNKSLHLKQLFIVVDFHRLRSHQTAQHSNLLEVMGKRYQQGIARFTGFSDPVMATLIRTVINGLVVEQMFADNAVTFEEQANLFVQMVSTYLQQMEAEA